jgi:hypothetical protein
MNLLDACLQGNESVTAEETKALIQKAQPAAVWAILLHAAAWHEQKTYDTPHSTIAAFSLHRMIEDLGSNPSLLVEDPKKAGLGIRDDLRRPLQKALITRLALNLAAVDHWVKERGPRYEISAGVDSSSNLLRTFNQSVRERSLVGAMSSAAGLCSRQDADVLCRQVLSFAAEDADNLGHGFILPVSLMTELPDSKYRHPHLAVLWHLMEFLLRKVPKTRPEKLHEDEDYHKVPDRENLTPSKGLFIRAAVDYGTLGHNTILAQRIAYAADNGFISSDTTAWLLKRLSSNIEHDAAGLTTPDTNEMIRKTKGTDWHALPDEISMPYANKCREMLVSEHGDIWTAMTSLGSTPFEEMILALSDKEFNAVRACQYALASLNGSTKSVHIIIYTQAAWDLADRGLIPKDLAALQVHRMVRDYLDAK